MQNTVKRWKIPSLYFFPVSFAVPATKVYIWSKTPFFRLLIPFVIGILIQWYYKFPLQSLIILSSIAFISVFVYQSISVINKYRFRVLGGLSISILLLFTGSLLVWINDIHNKQDWFGYRYKKSDILLLRIEEPLVEKQNSYKALASVKTIFSTNSRPARGKIILYFKKDSTANNIIYGSQLLVLKPAQEVKNSGNPGAFDYKRYNHFRGITHQVYLTGNDFINLKQEDHDLFTKFIYKVRSSVITILKRYIKSNREAGLAEALLIGYKDDLDKNLLQAYSNTGVVHLIAISGLHLGLIYWLLLTITRPMKINKLLWFRVIMIIIGIWLFCLLAGAKPSVVRSAVMFTVIALSQLLTRRASIFNTLALSAFILLCWDPFWLWDVGFQLSYAAVLSIVIFFRPIYNLVYWSNKGLDFIWKLAAVSISAQIFTAPISLYYFHQFPLLFFITNLVAVPLTSIILIGEIILCAVFFIEPVALFVGSVLNILIGFMNDYILRLDGVSFAVWNGIYISVAQTVLLTCVLAGLNYWLLEKKRTSIWFAAASLLIFITLRSASFISANNQKKLIVYNVPKYQAIDVIDGRKYMFIGDSILLNDGFTRNFHLQPSRILHRVKPESTRKLSLTSFSYYKKHILILDTSLNFNTSIRKDVDLLVLSKNPRIYITKMAESFDIKQIVADGSVPAWKVKLWKRDADSLSIPFHDVTQSGAFVMKL